MSEDLSSRFPQLRPIQSAPSLSTVAGIGCMVYGRREVDAETGTYVKTHWFTLLFVPVFALGAYRVADAPPGWHFHGREPLSPGAKAWNVGILCLLLGLIGFVWWNVRTNSEAALVRKKVDEADRLAEAGDLEKAALIYREVGQGRTTVAAEAVEKFKGLLGDRLDRASLRTVNTVLRLAVAWPEFPDVQAIAYERGLKLVEEKGKDNPREAAAVLEAISFVAPEPAAFARRWRSLLEEWGAARSEDLELVTALARACEFQRDADACEKLLAPHAHRLGTGEGARILGWALVHKGLFDQAHDLLSAYCTAHFERAKKAIQTAPRDNRDPGQAWELDRAGRVVAAMGDLALVHQYRGQTLPDAAERQAELAKAEKILLAVGSLPDNSSDLQLAKVYVRMGKQDQARQIFDAHLAAGSRGPVALFQVAKAQQEVGNIAEARSLFEEAIERAIDPKDKASLAPHRAMVATDLEDKLSWLVRGNLDDPEVRALLSSARADQAARRGDDEAAARHLRDALAFYDHPNAPPHPETLNNAGLAYRALYRVTGDRTALDRSTDLLQKALLLKPSNSIIVEDVLAALTEKASRDLIAGALDLDALRLLGDPENLRYLYKDRKGRDALRGRARKDSTVRKATALANRLLLMAPRRPASYHSLLVLLDLTGDRDGLRTLEATARKADLDLSHSVRESLDLYAGKKDAQRKGEMAGQTPRWEKRYDRLAKGSRGPTFALAADTLVRLLIDSEMIGVDVDADRVVRRAEEAHLAAPSRATQGTLVRALLFRAHRQLAGQEPEYNKMATRVRRALDPNYLLAVALSQGGKPRDAALANKDVRRAGELVRESATELPDQISPWACVLLQALHPEGAAARTEALAKNELGKLSRAITLLLSPARAEAALECYWELKLAGKEEQGKAILKRCADLGVPLPFDVR
ncbi:MAG: hypothetical protein HYS12_24825 [Planctomycetes bacterium]|nr:hypothetical protein [Planctomycetota bacterium]